MIRKLAGAALAIALSFGPIGLEGAVAQEMKLFRIGTGGVSGTYYPIGSVIANALSNPPDSRPCQEGGSCGVSGLTAIAMPTNASIANINAIATGNLESAFSQSDVAYWAYTGTGVFEGKPKIESLRLLANLYPESIHLVARKDAGITSVTDLKGKRVALDEPGSGTLAEVRIILGAYGLTEKDVKAEYVKPDQAGDKMRDGTLDAFFFVGGYPTGNIAELATSNAGITLVPISGPQVDKLAEQYRFFAPDTIPADVYKGIPETRTLSVNAQWVVSAKVDEELVYNIAKALWNDTTRQLLDAGHAKGRQITLKTALNSAAIPVHSGAERFYREAGLLK